MQDPRVIERLQQLAAENGGQLTPDAVVADAKKKASPLHRYFDWDDKVAAMKWRREQARQLIRSVRVEVEQQEIKVRAIGYVQDPDKDSADQGYVPTVTLKSDRDRAIQALEQELMRAEAAMNRAYEVASSLGLESEVDAILARIRGVRSAA